MNQAAKKAPAGRPGRAALTGPTGPTRHRPPGSGPVQPAVPTQASLPSTQYAGAYSSVSSRPPAAIAAATRASARLAYAEHDRLAGLSGPRPAADGDRHHALPQTDPIAHLWWKAYVGTLAVPVVQGFTLYAGQWTLTDPDHLLPVLGLPVEPGGVIDLFVVMVMLWTTLRVPALMRRLVSTGSGGRGAYMIGAAVRVIVVQQVTRSVPGLGRGLRAVGR